MSWQPTKPAASDQLSVSQADIQNNFDALDTWIDVNHINPSAGAAAGQHSFITFYPQSSTPGSATDIEMWGQNGEVYVQRASKTPYPMTADLRNAEGYCYLPSGLVMKWKTLSGTGAVTWTYSGSTPTFSAVYSAGISPFYDGGTTNNFLTAIRTLSTTAMVAFISTVSTTQTSATGKAYAWVIGL